MKKHLGKVVAAGLSASMALTLVGVTTFAYDRQESTVISGGTEVTVYSGTVNSNDEGNYLADPGDYEHFSKFVTNKEVVSTSNITSSTNYVNTIPGGAVDYGMGGVDGVTWDTDSSTLTLNNVDGTILTIEGPEINPYSVNTYNDKLNPVISGGAGSSDMAWASNLTYYYQSDTFIMGGSAKAPHTKDNATVQDVVYINLVGSSTLANIAVRGNVKVVFTGTGTLTVDSSTKSWDYDDYSDPNFNHLCDKSDSAIASINSIGYNGELKGTAKDETGNDHFTEIVEETFEYALPEFELADGVTITDGGSIINSSQLAAKCYFTYTGNGEFGTAIEGAAPLEYTGTIRISGTDYDLSYNADQSQFLLAVPVKEGMQTVTSYYDITSDVKAWAPYCSYIGTNGTCTTKVVIEGTGASDEVDMYRLYNSNTGEHLYTAYAEEIEELVAAGWQNEGVAWIAPAASDTPVYRLCNPNSGEHHYTIYDDEVSELTALGWINEGVAWYSGGDVSVYRLFNPNAASATHHYTGFQSEIDSLTALGWQAEGIAWNAISIPE